MRGVELCDIDTNVIQYDRKVRRREGCGAHTDKVSVLLVNRLTMPRTTTRVTVSDRLESGV